MRQLLTATIALAALMLPALGFPSRGHASFTLVQQTEQSEYAFIGDVVVSPDGRFVYATAPYASEIVVYERTADTGALTERFETATPSLDVDQLVVSPDGAHVYGVDYGDGSVTAFARDPVTGQVTPFQTQQVVVGGVRYLERPQGVAISGDGADLYVAGDDDDSVVHFRRDAGTGLLTFADVYVNGQGGIAGLDGPIGIGVTPDGTGVYVAGVIGNSLVAFRRDPSTGALEFVEAKIDAVELLRAFAVAASPDSAYVYVTANAGIVAYARDPLSSALTGVQATGDYADHDVWISADGRRAYACGGFNGLIGYARDPATGVLTRDEHATTADEGAGAPGYCFGMTIVPSGEQLYTIESFEPGEQVYTYVLTVYRHSHAVCAQAPQPGCRQTLKPTTSSLVLTHQPGGAKDKLKWHWKGAATSLQDLGDPVGYATDYALCLYDASGLVLTVNAPGSSLCDELGCWSPQSGTKYRYRDKAGRRNGLATMTLRSGADGAAKIDVLAKGPAIGLADAALAGVATVQVLGSDGQTSQCWEARYSAPTVDQASRYSARSD